MKNYKHGLVILCFLILYMFTSVRISVLTESQPSYFSDHIGLGTIIPPLDDDTLRLTNANITIITEFADKREFLMPIIFDCNYSVFNPVATTSIATIVFPISHILLHYTKTITTWFNGSEVEFQSCDNDLISELQELSIYHIDLYYFLCFSDVNLSGNSTSSFRIKIDAPKPIWMGRSAFEFSLIHNVQTSRFWNGETTKKVEFIIHGEQPFEHSNYSETTPLRKCSVTNYDNSSSYVWNWENERITEDLVDVTFFIPRDIPFTFLLNWDFGIIIMVMVSSSSVILVIKILRNKKKKC
ncbi:MAG: hypothetical protein KAS63_08930 [Candidatus Heimdallarchaeota archaeon]|nr:hypothetical protein [Candidatus Heimdallarchaeota archaeon]MCK4955472.1 hypothetical protein [Candidatus Heimdallarchaeota archaeon]